MVDFITPESVKELVPILVTEENIIHINNTIKNMIKNNEKNCTIICLSYDSDSAAIRDILERLCKLGWRVYGRQNNADVDLIVDNPYYKDNSVWVNELENVFKK